MVRNDQLVLVQEHVTNRDGLIQQAARVPAHIQNQAIQRGGIKLPKRIGNFAIGRFIESRQADVADAGLQHEGDVHGMPRNLVTGHGKYELFGIAFARNRNLDDRALRALQHVRHFSGGHAIRGFVIHFDNHVAWPDSCVISRGACIRRHHHRVVVSRRYDHTDAVVFSALVFTQQGKLLGVEKAGVGVEHAQHARNGALIDGLVHIDRIGIIVLHHVQNPREVPNSRLIIVRRGGRGSHVGAVNAPEHGGYQQYGYHNYKSATL
jgi:hypothetical protein